MQDPLIRNYFGNCPDNQKEAIIYLANPLILTELKRMAQTPCEQYQMLASLHDLYDLFLPSMKHFKTEEQKREFQKKYQKQVENTLTLMKKKTSAKAFCEEVEQLCYPDQYELMDEPEQPTGTGPKK